MLRLLFRVHFLFLVLMFPALLCGQEKSIDEQSVDAISHPEGLDVSLWAGSDQLSTPVAFTFDDQGRMFLCETFRQNKGVEDNRGHMDWLDDDLAAQSLEDRLAYFKHHLGDELAAYEAEEDRITVISDEDGDGRADKDWVFADGFSSALTGTGAGVLVLGNDVYYTCIRTCGRSPTLTAMVCPISSNRCITATAYASPFGDTIHTVWCWDQMGASISASAIAVTTSAPRMAVN